MKRVICDNCGNLESSKEGWWEVRAYSKMFWEWFQNLSIKTIERMFSSKKEICLFIRGFYDSDGDLTRDKRRGYIHVRIHNTNKQLLYFVKKSLEKIGITSAKIFLSNKAGQKTRINNKIVISRKDCYSLDIYSQADVKKFLKMIGSNIPRKNNKF